MHSAIPLRRLMKPLRAALTHPPRLIRCEICDGTRIQIRTDPSPRIGSRCLSCRGTAHHRAIFALIREYYGRHLDGLMGKSVYEISAHGALHKALRRHAAKGYTFTCSELLDGWEPGRLYDGVRCENLEALTFADTSLDLITSTGLMEHVEHDEQAFREIARVLTPHGRYLFTVPYHENCGTVIRAVRLNGVIKHLKKPEYHSDPWRPDGVFTWRNYGPDILDVLMRSGLRGEVRKIRVSGLYDPMPVIIATRSAGE